MVDHAARSPTGPDGARRGGAPRGCPDRRRGGCRPVRPRRREHARTCRGPPRPARARNEGDRRRRAGRGGDGRRHRRPARGHALPDGSCLSVEVQAEPPARTVDPSAVTAADRAQVWVPDSSLWLGQVQGLTMRPIGSLGTSPVVLAASPSTVERLGWRADRPLGPGAEPGPRLVAPAMTDDAPAGWRLLALGRSIGPGPRAQQAVAALVLAGLRTPAADLAAGRRPRPQRQAGRHLCCLPAGRPSSGSTSIRPAGPGRRPARGCARRTRLPGPEGQPPQRRPRGQRGDGPRHGALTSPTGARTARPPVSVRRLPSRAVTRGRAGAGRQVAGVRLPIRLLAQPPGCSSCWTPRRR